MSFDELTQEQKEFAEHDEEVFVKACPGAGKTHTVLARTSYVAKNLPLRKGVVLLSFTNSAVDEFKERSSKIGVRPIFDHPGFVGTFDSFIRTFVFLPNSVDVGIKPQVVDSWETLDAEIRLTGQQAHAWGVGLDCFDSVSCSVRIGNVHRRSQAHVNSNREHYERAARRYRDSLNGRGYFSAEQVRQIVLERVRNAEIRDSLGRALAARFYEIIVDEAQDCNPDDLEILSWLREYGVRITMVCDLDQSIYAFRGGDQEALEEFADTYGDNVKNISGNFRCSPAICLLAASLRSRGNPDESVGKTRDVAYPIALIPYDGPVKSSIGIRFIQHISSKEDADTLTSKNIILAHGRANARKASGSLAEPPIGQSRVEKMSFAVSEFWTPEATRAIRRKSINTVEKMILDYMGIREENETVESSVERNNINPRVLRRQTVGVLMSLDKEVSDNDDARSNWIDALRNSFEGLDITSDQSIRRFFTAPRTLAWSHYLRVSESDSGLPYATIHQAKGREFSAVCVVMPPDAGRNTRTQELMTSWNESSVFEPKNVIYVGVTRAQFMTALAIPRSFLETCESILTTSEVPYEIVG